MRTPILPWSILFWKNLKGHYPNYENYSNRLDDRSHDRIHFEKRNILLCSQLCWLIPFYQKEREKTRFVTCWSYFNVHGFKNGGDFITKSLRLCKVNWWWIHIRANCLTWKRDDERNEMADGSSNTFYVGILVHESMGYLYRIVRYFIETQVQSSFRGVVLTFQRSDANNRCLLFRCGDILV